MADAICKYLNSLNFHYSQAWVTDCVDYYQSSNPSISENELKEEVKQQWLLLNLRDVKVGVFPPNLKANPNVVLPGKYVVQVETLIDSGQSKYSQLQTLRNVGCDNVLATSKPDAEPPPRRCLTMTITDGVQDLNAMEYEVIPALRLNDPDLPPGFKMLISGPVTCRRGMILLSPKNVSVLGGEVDVFTEKNRYEALLVESLGLAGTDNSANPPLRVSHPPPTNSVSNRLADLLDDDDFVFDDLPMDTSADNGGSNINNQVSSLNNQTREARARSSNNFRETLSVPSTQPAPPPVEPSLDDLLSDADDVFLNIPDDDMIYRTQPHGSGLETSRRPVGGVQTSLKQYFAPTSLVKDDEVMEISPDPVEIPLPKKIISSEPFVYLAQIEQTQLTKNAVFKIKAVILTLKSKIAISGDTFTLQATISDGSLSADVQFSSEILENLLGFSPSEIKKMAKERNKNSAVAEMLKTAFGTAQLKLISLNCIFNIQFFANKSVPMVLSLEELSMEHLRALKARQI